MGAEEAVVAAILVDEGALARVSGLQPGDFLDHPCRLTFAACLALAERGARLDQVTVANELRERRQLEAVGGPGFLSRIIAELPTPIGVEHYAAIVKRDSVRRGLIGAGEQIEAIAADRAPADVGDLVRRSVALVRALGGPDDMLQQEGAGPVLVRLADVQREEVSWRWTGRLPVGKLTMSTGDPGVGKSWLSLAIGTAETTGAALPGDSVGHPPAHVLILTAEDGLADTVRPRLEDMGADLDRVTALTAVRDDGGREHAFDLTADLGHLEAALSAGGYGLVIIDPINAYLGGALDTHRDAAIRSVLGPLATLAERYSVAVLAIGHLTKGQRDRAIYRPQGGIAYIAAARVAWLVGQNPDNEAERVIAVIKNNLAPFPPSLGFGIEGGCFRWRGESGVTTAALLGPDASIGERSALVGATAFLRDVLAEGPLPVEEVLAEAKGADVAERTLRRAKDGLAVTATREGFGRGGRWLWSLPQTPIGGQPSIQGHVAINERTESERGPIDGHLCRHRPPGEADRLGQRGAQIWGEDAVVCACCGGPASAELADEELRCPTCRTGLPAPVRGGHLVRHLVDLGLVAS